MFPTKPAAFPDAHSCDDSIRLIQVGIYIYITDEAGQHRLAKGPGIARIQI
jgi:hypothetical protein